MNTNRLMMQNEVARRHCLSLNYGGGLLEPSGPLVGCQMSSAVHDQERNREDHVGSDPDCNDGIPAQSHKRTSVRLLPRIYWAGVAILGPGRPGFRRGQTEIVPSSGLTADEPR